MLSLISIELPEIVIHPSKEKPPKIQDTKNTVYPPSPSKSQTGHADKQDVCTLYCRQHVGKCKCENN